MFYALSWFLVFSLLALWSLAVWALHAVAVWAVANAGSLSGVASEVARGAATGVERLRLPDWLAPWVPSDIAQALTVPLAGLAPAVDSLLQAMPMLAGGLGLASWVVWGLGTALLLLLGLALHGLVAMWRRQGGGAGAGSAHDFARGHGGRS